MPEEKKIETADTPAQVLLALSGSRDDDRLAEEMINEIKTPGKTPKNCGMVVSESIKK